MPKPAAKKPMTVAQRRAFEKKRDASLKKARAIAAKMARAAPKLAKRKSVSIAELQSFIDAARRKIADITDGGGVGKPTTYRPEFASEAYALCLLGLTNDELAAKFKVSPGAFAAWIAEVPEFAVALYDGREGADKVIAGALYRAAMGYEHPEDDIRTVSRGGNDGSEIVITPTTKRYPPNYAALAMWMNTRQRKRWPRGEDGGSGGKTPAEIAREVQDAIAAAEKVTPQREEGEAE